MKATYKPSKLNLTLFFVFAVIVIGRLAIELSVRSSLYSDPVAHSLPALYLVGGSLTVCVLLGWLTWLVSGRRERAAGVVVNLAALALCANSGLSFMNDQVLRSEAEVTYSQEIERIGSEVVSVDEELSAGSGEIESAGVRRPVKSPFFRYEEVYDQFSMEWSEASAQWHRSLIQADEFRMEDLSDLVLPEGVRARVALALEYQTACTEYRRFLNASVEDLEERFKDAGPSNPYTGEQIELVAAEVKSQIPLVVSHQFHSNALSRFADLLLKTSGDWSVLNHVIVSENVELADYIEALTAEIIQLQGTVVDQVQVTQVM